MYSQSTVSSSSDEDGNGSYVKPKRSGIRRVKSDSVPTAVKRSISGDGLQGMIQVPITSPIKGSRNNATSHSDGERHNPRSNGGRGGVRRNNSSNVRNRDNNTNNNNNNNNRGPPNTPTRNNSMKNNNRSRSTGSRSPPLPPKRQVSSDNLEFALETLSIQPTNNDINNSSQQAPPPLSTRTVRKYLSPAECGDKAKTIFKEYFVSDDMKETVYSIQQVVGETDSDNYIERCNKVVEAGVLLVMEMKELETQKLLSVISECVTSKIISPQALVGGLKDPLEFLRDIEIDAPMAAALLSKIISTWIYHPGFIEPTNSVEFLITDSPEYFRSDGRAAEFAIRILYDVSKIRQQQNPSHHESNDCNTNTIITDESKQIIDRLLTECEMSTHGTVDNFIDTLVSKYRKDV